MIDMTVCEAVERAEEAYDAATSDAERVRIASERVCSHPLVCGDAACRAAGHAHEMVGGMDEGWSCDNDECQCVATCGLPLVTAREGT